MAYLICPSCLSTKVHRAAFSIADIAYIAALRSPFVCRNCYDRFHDFAWRKPNVRRWTESILIPQGDRRKFAVRQRRSF